VKRIDWELYAMWAVVILGCLLFMAVMAALIIDANYESRNDPPGMTCSSVGDQRVCISEVER